MHVPSPLHVNSWIWFLMKNHLVSLECTIDGWIYYFLRKRQKKDRGPPSSSSPSSWCSHDVQYCTITKLKKGGCCISVSPFGLRLIFLVLGSKHPQYKKHGYLLWQCHVSLNKKKKKSGKSSWLMFLKTALPKHRQTHCIVTSKSIYLFLEKIKYDHEYRHTLTSPKISPIINISPHGIHSLNA